MDFTLRNGNMEAAICSTGAELVSLKKDGKEYLWGAEPAYWNRHAPILFPFVGNLRGKQYRYEGKTYEMGTHGFARDMEFTPVSRTDTKLVMALSETEETMKNYPFCFLLELSYELKEDGLVVGWSVANKGEKKMYFSIGGHPGFNCPIDGKGKQSDYMLRFMKDGRPMEEIISEVIGEGGFVTGEKLEFGLEDGYLPITPELFDTDTIVLEDGQADTISLYDPDGKEYVRMSFPMPIVAIWTAIQKNAPFICIEPWCGRCDDADFAGELPQKAWENELEPGKVFETAYTIIVK
ncbi:MAG: aldose 1-epimerase family protein [Lachnospiraceae bacterium]|nr:aldose 1-epimerase family protein [Lachnospiraceae bacterium]